MITAFHIRQRLQKKPFKPFTLHVGGFEDSFSVEQPTHVRVVDETIVIEIPGTKPSAKFPKHMIEEFVRGSTVQISQAHVTHVTTRKPKTI